MQGLLSATSEDIALVCRSQTMPGKIDSGFHVGPLILSAKTAFTAINESLRVTCCHLNRQKTLALPGFFGVSSRL
jgi:hypothetical protein